MPSAVDLLQAARDAAREATDYELDAALTGIISGMSWADEEPNPARLPDNLPPDVNRQGLWDLYVAGFRIGYRLETSTDYTRPAPYPETTP